MFGLSGLCSLCIVLGKQSVQVVLILAVAEVAHHLTGGILVPHPLKLGTAKAEQHLLGAFGADRASRKTSWLYLLYGHFVSIITHSAAKCKSLSAQTAHISWISV